MSEKRSKVLAFLESEAADGIRNWRDWFRAAMENLYWRSGTFFAERPVYRNAWQEELGGSLNKHGINFSDVLKELFCEPTKDDCSPDKEDKETPEPSHRNLILVLVECASAPGVSGVSVHEWLEWCARDSPVVRTLVQMVLARELLVAWDDGDAEPVFRVP